MKTMKRFAGLLLALVMILTMTVTASATSSTEDAGKGSITIDNPQKLPDNPDQYQEYHAYKIFDVTYGSDKKVYSYSINSESKWFPVLTDTDADGKVTSKVDGLEFKKTTDAKVYTVIKKDGFSAASFAALLKQNVSGKEKSDLEIDKTDPNNVVAKVEGLELGYYFVDSTSGAICNLTTTNANVTIHDKNDIPFTKTDDKTSVQLGEIVTYTLTGKVPDTTGFTTYDYIITDKMDDGLTFKQDVTVRLGENVLANTFYDIEYNQQDGDGTDYRNGFKLTIHAMDLQDNIGKSIKVIYSARVNENAAGKIEYNHASLKYSNDPNDNTKHNTINRTENVYSARIIIDKYRDNNENLKLNGAQFVLRKLDDGGTKVVYYKRTTDATTGEPVVEWTENKNDATVVTTEKHTNADGTSVEGYAEFPGLKKGTYTLQEVKAPDGYNLLDHLVDVTVLGTDATVTEVLLTVTQKIDNSSGSLLPATGGIGTTLFYILGAILVIGAGVLLINRRRMNADK